MNTVLTFSLCGIGPRSQCHKEAEFVVLIEAEEVLDSLRDSVDKVLDHVKIECPCKTLVLRIMEVQVNQKRLRLILPRLLHEVLWGTPFHEEIVVQEVEKHWVFLVRNLPFTERDPHSGHGGIRTIVRLVLLEKS